MPSLMFRKPGEQSSIFFNEDDDELAEFGSNPLVIKCVLEDTVLGCIESGNIGHDHSRTDCNCFLTQHASPHLYQAWPRNELVLHGLAWLCFQSCHRHITSRWLHAIELLAMKEAPGEHAKRMTLQELARETIIGHPRMTKVVVQEGNVGKYVKDEQEALRFAEIIIEKFILYRLQRYGPEYFFDEDVSF